jgi:GNAT superfamily N-acetyltransferase
MGDPDLPVFRYVKNWGRPGDAGVIASAGPNAYGAAWYRLFPASAPGFAFVDEQTPEVTIAVVPSHRGKGTGGELLEALLERARADGFSQLSLSAEPGQTGFYEKYGFRELRREDGTVTMVASL